MENHNDLSLSPLIALLIALFCLNAFATSEVLEEGAPVFKVGFVESCLKENESLSQNVTYCAGNLAWIAVRYATQPFENHDCKSLRDRIQTLEQMRAEFEYILKLNPSSSTQDSAQTSISNLEAVRDSTLQDLIATCEAAP